MSVKVIDQEPTKPEPRHTIYVGKSSLSQDVRAGVSAVVFLVLFVIPFGVTCVYLAYVISAGG